MRNVPPGMKIMFGGTDCTGRFINATVPSDTRSFRNGSAPEKAYRSGIDRRMTIA